MGHVDRRQFLQQAAATSAVAGMAWVAPSVLGSSSAWAVGSCVNHAALLWSGVNTAASASNPNANVVFNTNIAASGTSPAIHVRTTIAPVGSPGDGNADGAQGGGTFDGHASNLKLSMTNNAAAEGYNVTFDFFAGTGTGTTPVNVYNLNFSIIDIDRNNVTNGFNDAVTATAGFTTTFKGTEINTLGNGTSTPWQGTGTGGITDDSGTVSINYAGPVNSVTVQYRSFEILNGVQSIAFTDLNWCY